MTLENDSKKKLWTFVDEEKKIVYISNFYFDCGENDQLAKIASKKSDKQLKQKKCLARRKPHIRVFRSMIHRQLSEQHQIRIVSLDTIYKKLALSLSAMIVEWFLYAHWSLFDSMSARAKHFYMLWVCYVPDIRH